jgi:putative ABC transport system substrate-binding protein
VKRRTFITLLGGAAAWPPGALAQQSAKPPMIGILATGPRATWGSWTDAFVERLRGLGWIDGRTVAFAYRWAEGRRARFTEFAAEFVRLGVDVILTSGAAGVDLKRTTSTIPIVLAVAQDPLGEGLVTSLARPGGNITGLSLQGTDVAGKRLGLLREVLPSMRRLAILADVGYPSTVIEMREAQTAASMLGLEVVTLEARQTEDIAPAFESHKGRADALFVGGGPLMTSNQIRINTLALAARLPTVSIVRESAEAGALMSYGAHFPSLFQRAADYVDKILRGAKPADIPVEQPTKFELVINLKTAMALGLDVPTTLLARADEVIE